MNDHRPIAAGNRQCRAVWHTLLAAFLLLGPRGGTAQERDRLQERALLQLDLLSQVFRQAYQQASPAVVLVTTRQARLSQVSLPPFHPLPRGEEPGGLGSGALVSADGYILSNHHVISGADSIWVTLCDRRVFPARVVGSDPLIDIALLKIDAAGLPAAILGNSDELQVGDWVLAIGHPLGMGSTLTHGIVGALGRQAALFKDDYSIENFIQTNAAINQGNSGGPLLNLRGEVVGINTAISTPTGYFIGYGLAVPINLAREAMRDLLAHGRVVRGYLGISMQEVTQELIARHDLDLARPRGVYIASASGPASRGGLAAGDLLLQVEGKEVEHPNQVQALIYAKDPGDTVSLTLLRQGALHHLSVILGEREEDLLLAQGHKRIEELGISVQELGDETAGELGFTQVIAAQLGFEEGERPVVVVSVDPESLAAARGIAARDVIAEIDQHRVTSLDEFTRLIARLEPGKSALFWLWRRDQGLDVRALKISQ